MRFCEGKMALRMTMLKKVAVAASQAVQAEAAPAPVRRYRALMVRGTLVVFVAAFAVLTLLVKTIPSFAIDLQITKAIQMIHFPAFTWLMNAISWPGFVPQSIIISALIVVLLFCFGLHWEAVVALVGAVFPTAVNLLVKDLVGRPRPDSSLVNVYAAVTDYSFPSGHVMFYLGVFGFVWFLAFTLLKHSIKRTLLLVLFGILIALVGVSRIYVGEHWASDVLGAYLLGSVTLVAIIQFYIWGKTRFFVHQPAAPTGPQPK